MITLKTSQEIEIMHEGGRKLKSVVNKLLPQIKPGMTTLAVEQIAQELIHDAGAEPSFSRVPGYKWATCLPVNEQVVHTPPSQMVLKSGDVLTVDIGVFYKGFHTDYADTIIVGGSRDAEKETFLKVGQEALEVAIGQVQNGHHLGEISQTIQSKIEGAGYKILRELTGHGIGRQLHEDPYVPGYLDKPVAKTYRLRPGLVIAVEVIYSQSTEKIAYEERGGWSITSADRSLTACFEKTVAITDTNTIILT